MEKILEIDIIKETDLYEKYNRKKLSKGLINYIIEMTPALTKEDTIKVIINSNLKIDIIDFIKTGLKEELNKSILKFCQDNIIQVIYLIIGILAIFLSTIIDQTVAKEIVLIGGWVFIWGMLESEIFTDIVNVKKRRILKKLLDSEFEIKNIEVC